MFVDFIPRAVAGASSFRILDATYSAGSPQDQGKDTPIIEGICKESEDIGSRDELH